MATDWLLLPPSTTTSSSSSSSTAAANPNPTGEIPTGRRRDKYPSFEEGEEGQNNKNTTESSRKVHGKFASPVPTDGGVKKRRARSGGGGEQQGTKSGIILLPFLPADLFTATTAVLVCTLNVEVAPLFAESVPRLPLFFVSLF